MNDFGRCNPPPPIHVIKLDTMKNNDGEMILPSELNQHCSHLQKIQRKLDFRKSNNSKSFHHKILELRLTLGYIKIDIIYQI